MVLSLTWVTMAATEMTDAELYGLSFFFSSVMVVVADAASSRVKQEGLSQILPGLRRPYFCLSPGTGNEWNKNLEFLKECSCWMFSCLLTGEHRRGYVRVSETS